MRGRIRRLVRRLFGRPVPMGEEGLREVGHRAFVGGKWEQIGRHQFDYMVSQGLKPEHVFLDIACGSLRGGVHFIRYLDSGHYLGIDQEPLLVQAGIDKELGKADFEAKRPEFVISSKFEFERFPRKPDRSLAQSLFTHLRGEDIRLCLGNLRRFVGPGHVFYATFNEGTQSGRNPAESHSHDRFEYSREEMAGFGESCGWKATYVGDWGHPRGQMMMRFGAE